MFSSIMTLPSIVLWATPSYGERKEGLVNVVQGFGHVCVNRGNFEGRYLLHFMCLVVSIDAIIS